MQSVARNNILADIEHRINLSVLFPTTRKPLPETHFTNSKIMPLCNVENIFH